MDFSTKLRNLRIRRGLTQMQLAERIGTSQAAITSYEQKRREPSFETIRKFAEFFNVPMSALLPSDDTVEEDFVLQVSESLHTNSKLKLLFDRTRYMDEKDLDTILAVANAISRERENND